MRGAGVHCANLLLQTAIQRLPSGSCSADSRGTYPDVWIRAIFRIRELVWQIGCDLFLELLKLLPPDIHR